MEQLPLPVLVLLVVAAVIAGLWVGARAGSRLQASEEDGKKKPLAARAREAATSGVIRLWKWNRARKKKQQDA